MSKTPPPQIAARLSQTSDALPPCNHPPTPASPPSSPDLPSSATQSTPPASVDANDPRTCPSDRPPFSILPSIVRESRSQHALSAIPPPPPQDSASAATPQMYCFHGSPPPHSTTPQT